MKYPFAEGMRVGFVIAFVAFLLSASCVVAATMTDAEAKKQLALESQNLVAFGNPFGKTGKFEELYDPTGKPWWMIQLAKEAWSMETYGNPFGYPIAQRVIGSPAPIQPVFVTQDPTLPVIKTPSPVQPFVSEPTPVETPHFVGSPYFVSVRDYVSDSMAADGALAIAIRFSEPLPASGGASQPYRLLCVNPSNPMGVGIMADPLSAFDDGTRRVAIVYGFGDGHYSCRFKFIDPVSVESETIEFDL
jgi:hypothetical protein